LQWLDFVFVFVVVLFVSFVRVFGFEVAENLTIIRIFRIAHAYLIALDRRVPLLWRAEVIGFAEDVAEVVGAFYVVVFCLLFYYRPLLRIAYGFFYLLLIRLFVRFWNLYGQLRGLGHLRGSLLGLLRNFFIVALALVCRLPFLRWRRHRLVVHRVVHLIWNILVLIAPVGAIRSCLGL